MLEDDEDEDFLSPSAAEAGGRGAVGGNERTPLLRGQSMTRHRRTRSTATAGTASTTQAVMMVSCCGDRFRANQQLLKGFIGTGILFMGKA